MTTLHVMMGVPGCGKSSHAETVGCDVVSSDEIRRAVTGQRSDLTRDRDVWRQVEERLRTNLTRDRDVVLDSTNVRASYRRGLIKLAHDAEAAAHLIIVRVDSATALRQNRDREDAVPFPVMLMMLENFNRSLGELGWEQWDAVTNVWPPKAA